MADDRRDVHSADQIKELLSSESARAINEYLILMEDTESPRVFHTWSLLSSASALLGKNSELRMGAFLTVRPNLFVVLIGPPATRKSTPIDIVTGMLEGTSLNFGPTDSGGQRHGLMSALTGVHRYQPREARNLGFALSRAILEPRHPSDMALFVSELGRLWGTSNREIADFFVDLYDGQEIDYETKASSTRIASPLVTLLGATTPSSLASMLPENATTHGVLSRIVFVYGDTNYKSVPIPPDPTEEWIELRASMVDRFRWIDNNRRDFGLSLGARKRYEELYEYRAKLEDSRLESYQGRRANTLMRVAMAIAALRYDTWVIDDDVNLAHHLLAQLEPTMHKALESFGTNKAYRGRQIILQFLRSRPDQRAGLQDVIAAAAAEMNNQQAQEVLQSMAMNKEITIYGSRVILGNIDNKKAGA